MLTSGTYGALGSTYATESESFAQVRAAAVAEGSGPASFEVLAKNGMRYEYGGTAARAPSSGTAISWSLTRVTDASGNSLVYQYDTSVGGIPRLAHIDYPITATGAGPLYRVSFVHEARPDATDMYVDAEHMVLATRVARVVVERTDGADGAAPALITSYELRYSTGASGRSRLSSITQCDAQDQCLVPLTMEHEDDALGFTAAPTAAPLATGDGHLVPMDLNGDALADTLWCQALAGATECTWYARLGTPSGAGPDMPVALPGFVSPVDAPFAVGRIGGLGRDQIALALGTTAEPETLAYHVLTFDSSTQQFAMTPLGVTGHLAGAVRLADVTGDGLPEFVQSANNVVTMWKNITSPGGAPTLGAAQTVFIAQSGGSVVDAIAFLPSREGQGGVDVADWNGDGRADLAITEVTYAGATTRFFVASTCTGASCPAVAAMQHTHTVLDRARYGFMPLDWNGDSCADYLLGNSEWSPATVEVSNCKTDFVTTPLVEMSNWATTRPLAMDADGDGKDEILYYADVFSGYARNDLFDHALSHTVSHDGTASFTSRSLGDIYGNDESEGVWYATVTDVNADGRSDFQFQLSNPEETTPIAARAWLAPSTQPDRVTGFTDSNNNTVRVTYEPLTTPGLYQAGTGAVLPMVDVASTQPVVSRVTWPAGVVDALGVPETYQTAYQYGASRVHLQGRGHAGFGFFAVTDLRNGARTETTFAQAFPFVQMATTRRQIVHGATVSVWSATHNQQRWEAMAGDARVFAFVEAETETQFELGTKTGVTTVPGKRLQTTTRTRSFGDGAGNLTAFVTSTVNEDASSSFVGERDTVSEVTSYDNAPVGCSGLRARSTTTYQRTGVADLARTTAYVNDLAHCRVTQTIDEPDNALLATVTDVSYDACGNTERVTIMGRAPDGTPLAPRTSSTSFGARCQFAEASTNSLGETTRTTYDPAWGKPLSATDPNGLVTHFVYDGFGRLQSMTAPDGTSTSIAGKRTAGNGTAITTTTLDANGAVVADSTDWLDALDRVVATTTSHPLTGATITQSMVTFDRFGRVVESRGPALGVAADAAANEASARGRVALTYDDLGRVVARELVGDDVPARTTTTYDGYTTILVDPLGAVHVTMSDQSQRVRRRIDPAVGGATPGITTFGYDAMGREVSITGPEGQVFERTYNALGAIASERDPNAGEKLVQTNTLGELVAMRDAKGQWMHYAYDALGRKVAQSHDAWATQATWTYGADPAAHNVGQLVRISGTDGYEATFRYDALARLASQTLSTAGETFTYDLSYNAAGQLAQTTYPAVADGSRFVVRRHYRNSELVALLGPDDTALWTARTMDESGKITVEDAMGITVKRAFTKASGLPTSIVATNATTGAVLQHARYAWDPMGNLGSRTDAREGTTESFRYDALGRLLEASGGPNA